MTQTETAPPVPALYNRDGGVDMRDVAIPNVYVMADLSKMVKARKAFPGEVVVAMSADGEGAQHLVEDGDKDKYFDAYVIGRKRTVIYDDGKGTFEYLDDDYVPKRDERDVWVGYNYLLYIPQYSPYLPVRCLFIKTSGIKGYKALNNYMMTADMEGQTDPLHIRFSVITDRGRKSGIEYYRLSPSVIPADESVDTARAMYTQTAGMEPEPSTTAPAGEGGGDF